MWFIENGWFLLFLTLSRRGSCSVPACSVLVGAARGAARLTTKNVTSDLRTLEVDISDLHNGYHNELPLGLTYLGVTCQYQLCVGATFGVVLDL